MRKTFFVLLALSFIFFACDNDDMNNGKEENPYPDGVYPFEVSNVSHSRNSYPYGFIEIKWDNPADYFYTQIELFEKDVSVGIAGSDSDSYITDLLIYSSISGINEENNSVSFGIIKDFILNKNIFSFVILSLSDIYINIKCVDKFGNVSKGVRYDFNSRTES